VDDKVQTNSPPAEVSPSDTCSYNNADISFSANKTILELCSVKRLENKII
jgi:hypothetical protein